MTQLATRRDVSRVESPARPPVQSEVRSRAAEHVDHRPTELPETFPAHSTSADAPNLATLDMLRSRGRNPLLSVAGRRPRPTVRGCSSR